MPAIGDLVGDKYRLERELGRGGMGAVFEAVHTEIGKRVAIKFLSNELAADAEGLSRFKREARAAAAAGHRGIIDVHDIGTADDGSPYLVMELLEGRNLAETLGEGTMEHDATAYLGCQLLSALEAAHRAGVVHRDIKPANIFLVDSGAPLPEVKLVDFGISRVVGPSSVDRSESTLTQTGLLLGTPHYMSPEQARGQKDVDARTDVYSLGAVLYECLTGRPPFDGDNYNALIASILTEPLVEPTVVRPDVPGDLEAVLLKALARDREERFGSAAEMLEALLPFVDEAAATRIPVAFRPRDSEVPGRSEHSSLFDAPTAATVLGASSRLRSLGPPLVGAALVLCLAAVGAVLLLRPSAEGEGPGETGGAPAVGAVAPAAAVAGERESDAAPRAKRPPAAEARADGGAAPADAAAAAGDSSAVEASGPARAGPPPPDRGPLPARPERPAKRVQGRFGTSIETEYEED